MPMLSINIEVERLYAQNRIMWAMDMNNVKLDWAPILEGQIKHLEATYPDLPIRKSFQPVIESLNSNQIKSRVILSGINVSGYAFVTPSHLHKDRLHATVGFTDPKFATEDRVDNLMGWLEGHARAQGKYLMLNELYNAEDKSDSFLFSRNYGKLVRDRMVLDLGDLRSYDAPLKGNYESISLNRVDYEKYSDAEFDAFSGTGDIILFNSDNRQERIDVSKGMLTGQFDGGVVESATRVLALEGEIVASTLTTEYMNIDEAKTALLAELFVDRKLRGNGIAKHLLTHTLNSLKLNGYGKCALWVSEGNPARKLYTDFGFSNTKTQEIFYYRKL